MRLIIEKIKLALFKRTGAVQQKKNHASWEAKGYRNEPAVSFIIQSHNKSLQICHILPKLRQFKDAEIIVIDDGSSMEHTKRLTEALTGANEFMLRANDLFENVTYDKAIRLANGKYLALMQDDDDFEDVSWVTEAIELFNKYPKMVILGGKWALDVKFHPEQEKGCGTKREMGDAKFRFVDAVNRAPMWIRKDLYEQHPSGMVRCQVPLTDSWWHASVELGIYQRANGAQRTPAIPDVCRQDGRYCKESRGK